jgi:hypothetical protein
MKRTYSLLLAVVSTMFLLIGSARAAERFDSIDQSKITPTSDTVMDGPQMPCMTGQNEN